MMNIRREAELTHERYRCLERHCRHRGPAIKDVTVQHHGDGAWETVYEPICEKCGGNRVEEITDVDSGLV